MYLVTAALVGCGADQRPAGADASLSVLAEPAPLIAAGDHAAVRALALTAVMNDAPATYHFVRKGTGFVAVNAAQGFETRVGPAGVTVAGATFTWSMRAHRVGRLGAMQVLPEVAPTVTANHASYARPGWTEWYVHGTEGIEHGLEITERPKGIGEVVVELSCAGLRATMAADGKTADLRDDLGRVVLHYGELRVVDADRRALPARLVVDGDRIALRIADTGARYPLAVDPLLWAAQQQKLTAGDPATSGFFGYSVSISGDTALVGAHGYVSSTGAAYVFVRSGTTWNAPLTGLRVSA